MSVNGERPTVCSLLETVNTMGNEFRGLLAELETDTTTLADVQAAFSYDFTPGATTLSAIPAASPREILLWCALHTRSMRDALQQAASSKDPRGSMEAYFQRVEKAEVGFQGGDLVPRRVDILDGRVEHDGRPFLPIRNLAGHAGQAYGEAADGLRPIPCCFMCKLTMGYAEVCRGARGSNGGMEMFDRNKGLGSLNMATRKRGSLPDPLYITISWYLKRHGASVVLILSTDVRRGRGRSDGEAVPWLTECTTQESRGGLPRPPTILQKDALRKHLAPAATAIAGHRPDEWHRRYLAPAAIAGGFYVPQTFSHQPNGIGNILPRQPQPTFSHQPNGIGNILPRQPQPVAFTRRRRSPTSRTAHILPRQPQPLPVIDPNMPAAQMTNSSGGMGCEPGYNYQSPCVQNRHPAIANRVFKTMGGGGGKWYKGLDINGGDKEAMKKTT
ncbi:Uncharacterized protein TPAR_07831 [Tolypocladium paradoxum]|uniref:Uncharacterized protein n=1 Tax=Tolypocladium paradoxum TaxID=94208 RepID=A0A2S4KP47_9HYPO|nr:Uncharacterized protein TPAR_07831 [Tolypocladium paradoxum]